MSSLFSQVGDDSSVRIDRRRSSAIQISEPDDAPRSDLMSVGISAQNVNDDGQAAEVRITRTNGFIVPYSKLVCYCFFRVQ